MKPLQNYIEEEIEKAKEYFKNGKKVLSPELVVKYYNEEFFDFLSQSLHRMAEITAREIVPESKKFKVMGWIEREDVGYNDALSDLQDKIKEFGI